MADDVDEEEDQSRSEARPLRPALTTVAKDLSRRKAHSMIQNFDKEDEKEANDGDEVCRGCVVKGVCRHHPCPLRSSPEKVPPQPRQSRDFPLSFGETFAPDRVFKTAQLTF